MSESLNSYLILSAALLSIGVYGLLARRNLIGILISLELILNAASLNFIAFNKFLSLDKGLGQIFSLFIIGLAAAEVVIALSIVLHLHRGTGDINIEKVNHLKH